jgi:anti-anti-sigma regulatory factor
MEITVTQEQGRVPVTVLHVKGDVNASTADQFLEEAQRAYENGARDMLIDLSGVSLLSSAGLRALHSIFNMLRSDLPEESDGAVRKGLTDGTFKSPHLKLLKPDKNVTQVLSMAGFDMFLEIYNNLKKAVASF